jgi:D-serine deaminase-like pyridoxal phosphate-dependent protein
MNILDIPTPALILDRERFMNNIAHMRDKLADFRIPLRPHLKTCKSVQAARHILDGQPQSITVSTLHEAEYFLAAGYTDILYAVSITPNKLKQIQNLQKAGANISVILDDLEAANMVNEEAIRLGTVIPVLIEIDSDGKRAGLTADAPSLLNVARQLQEGPGTTLAGVMTHAGGSYYCKSTEAISKMAEQERNAITSAAARITKAGLPCQIISMGSTPTALFAENLNGVTEIRAGVFVFHDIVMRSLGVCKTSDIALSVLATIIGHKTDKNRLLVDAGSLALSNDRGKPIEDGSYKMGQIVDVETAEPYAGLWIDSTNQEHGLISLEHSNYTFNDFPIGSQIRIFPNHACITAAAYPQYYVVDGSDKVIEKWDRCNGW